MTGVRIGLAQLSLAPLDVASNIERTVAAVEKAAADGADVVVLPELASSGYVLHEPMLRSVAERTDRPGAALRAWADVAAATRTTVVAGLPESDGDALYNTAVVLGPDGRVVTRYRKLHLF
ncbi:MAG: hydratase, partial [Nocardioidaceae bacterium]|nr:hydratase [Nocardioidaceae bacterium]